MKRFVQGEDRTQVTLLPECLDDFVSDTNPAPHGGGFSVDARVCIGADDRVGLKRLLRYCARPPFAMERLHRIGQDHLLYHCPKPQSGGSRAI